MTRLTREESRQRTRQRIRDAAVVEFACRGVGGVSVEAIANAAGFSGGAFYSNYRNKNELLVDVMRSMQVTESEEWQRVIARGRTVDDVLQELASRAEVFARQRDWLLMKIELELRAIRDAEFVEDFGRYRRELRQSAIEVLRSLYDKAGKQVPLHIDMIADAWLAISNGIGLYFISEMDASRRTTIREAIFIPFLTSLIAQAEPLSPAEG